MKQCLFVLLSLGLSVITSVSFASEKSYSTPNRTAVIVDGDNTNQRLCYYQGQAYSEGSLLEVGGFLLRCENATDFETNGRLKWQSYSPEESRKTNR